MKELAVVLSLNLRLRRDLASYDFYAMLMTNFKIAAGLKIGRISSFCGENFSSLKSQKQVNLSLSWGRDTMKGEVVKYASLNWIKSK